MWTFDQFSIENDFGSGVIPKPCEIAGTCQKEASQLFPGKEMATERDIFGEVIPYTESPAEQDEEQEQQEEQGHEKESESEAEFTDDSEDEDYESEASDEGEQGPSSSTARRPETRQLINSKRERTAADASRLPVLSDANGKLTLTCFNVTEGLRLGNLRVLDCSHPTRKMSGPRHCFLCRWLVNQNLRKVAGKTSYCCETCRLPLCFTGQFDCFKQFHDLKESDIRELARQP